MFKWVLLSGLLFLGCGSLVDESEPIRTLEEAGYSDANCYKKNFVTPSFSGCSKSDDVAFTCNATNPAGKRVTVTVCSNYMFKGSTIRH